MKLYILCASFLGLLVLQALWSRFAAYPIAFEKNLKKGKSWVYIPVQWKGFRKLRILILSKVIIVCLAVAGGVLLASLTHKHASSAWLLIYAVITVLGAFKLNDFWLARYFHLQEDCYFLMFDELRAKVEIEGRDMTEAAFKSLADYQYQNHLRKADENGRLLEELRSQSRRSRLRSGKKIASEQVEA
jgi:hypothetical protein